MKKALLFLVIIFLPLISQAKALEFSAWVPYWKKTAAVAETQVNLNKLTTIMPFSYEVKADGTVWDPMKITKEPWPSLLAQARTQKVKIVPSILWNDGTAIQKVLATKKTRDAHIKQINDLVRNNNYSGIDIDYEGKTVKSFNTFSAFIRDLSTALHQDTNRTGKKILSCTIEPRLPPTSRFLKVPEEIEYANNYIQLNKYCDEVRLMAYDQMTADILLNKRKKSLGLPGQAGYYTPVADLDFVKKVVAYASHEINPAKIVLGVANYGYAYQVIDKGTYYDYKKLSALSYKTFTDLAKSTGSTPTRNTAGELSFTYYKTIPPTPSSGETKQTRFAVLSDSVAIASKIKLAKNLGLKGVALFKIDGESDPNLWGVLK
jgi:spore germination protein YaaH